ncbi:MSMEG_4193 family putative phosphomutase [Intrasporangium calvum]|uniref:MSMEG_4193 family putative phosphomutase n=1 Tax=Intrasporangium calvum TaxID=53358 RepID=UPI000DF608B8|nr:MSMEG_4193 family putative phosphomutase [Intrasporangium calvum]AXG13309.1 MSMEG_4193 family putative phosphomutase [Intrasporangium calvum]
MPTVLFVRHGRSSANTAGVLAGWAPGVFLDATGEAQASRVGAAIADAGIEVSRLVSSPLDRCLQTADLIAGALGPLPRSVHPSLGECRYGAWTGRAIRDLVAEPLWEVVQDRPSEVRFPASEDFEAESLVEVQERALAVVRETDAHVLEQHGPDAVWVAVSHGDVIKAVLAHAAGARLDDFQRFVVDPGSVSVVHYTSRRPFLVRLNDVGGDLGALRPATAPGREGDAVLGGGAGSLEVAAGAPGDESPGSPGEVG